MLDTARFWVSRVRTDASGRSHLPDVIGPDEYHELIDDNAFTNVMARANLRWAAELAERFGGAGAGEVAHWRQVADGMVDGYDSGTGVYEQFAGYHRLEPLLVEDVASPPIAADVLLGRDRIARTQLIKQADVLMLHHMLPDLVEDGSLEANLAYYQARTAHGSSLSPAIHAALMARVGRVEEALEWFRLAARLDLDDLTGTTAGGIHLANMGGVWQALAMGFLGMAVTGGALRFDPHLPASWSSLTQHFHVLGTAVRVRAGHREVEVESDRPLAVLCGDARTYIPTTCARFVMRSGEWEDRS